MDLKGRTVFVCGPTWGHLEMNAPALEDAARRLRNEGALTLVMEACDPHDQRAARAAIRRNVRALTSDDVWGLVCLPRSENSTDCMLLRDVAVRCGIPILSLERALS